MEYNFDPNDSSELPLVDPKSVEMFRKFREEERQRLAEKEDQIAKNAQTE